MRNNLAGLAALALSVSPIMAQESEPDATWTWRARAEVRANYRDSKEQRVQSRFPFRPEMLPVGQTVAFMETPDAGSHAELSLANVQLDLGYGNFLAARAKIHAIDKYRGNPTSTDRKVNADELWVRLGQNPEILERPEKTSFFVQAGKFPKMERQPLRLLESYGLAATAFNRFEDVQVMAGGTVGRNLYWRLVGANGNPLFFRDSNALAGDNGVPELLRREVPDIKSGFPILYNAEVEGLFFDTTNVQFGQAVGYRWQRDDGTLGFDAIVFHYRRELAQEVDLEGTFYGGDLDLLDGVGIHSLPISGNKKEEVGARLYAEWHGLTAVGQYTRQDIAGLEREGYEFEAGYRIALPYGPLQYIQPAARFSRLDNDFRGPATFPSPSVWWPWAKTDVGVRIGFTRGLDVTVEYSTHEITTPAAVDPNPTETLVTLRWRVG